ncbi:MAG TPA: ATP-binding cassette domain-containing protein [Chitinophagales bacterium]|nr:ATP-binding cassette domain-containing protein [Chitinophagales bacterium]
MNEKKAILQARQIGKYFHDPVTFKVLDNISFEAYQGEFLTIVGKSGCGKSTLLYVLSTMDTDFEGELWIDGQNISRWSQDKLALIRNEKIGFVFQFHYLLQEFSCLKNVMLPAMKLGKYSLKKLNTKPMKSWIYWD